MKNKSCGNRSMHLLYRVVLCGNYAHCFHDRLDRNILFTMISDLKYNNNSLQKIHNILALTEINICSEISKQMMDKLSEEL